MGATKSILWLLLLSPILTSVVNILVRAAFGRGLLILPNIAEPGTSFAFPEKMAA
jgi:hypothetical protein